MQKYRLFVQEIKAPDHVIDGIRRESESLRTKTQINERSKDKPAKPTARRREQGQRGKFALPAVAAAGCIVLLAVGIALAGHAVSQAPGDEDRLSGFQSSPGAPNFFTLAAYADENPENAPGEAVILDLSRFSINSFGGTSNEDPGMERKFTDHPGWAYAFYGLDLTCTGDNISSVEYDLSGDYATFGGVVNTEDRDGRFAPEDSTSFIVEYGSQGADKEHLLRLLQLEFPLGSEAAAACLTSNRSLDSEKARLKYAVAVNAASAHVLERVTLRLTATFTDGSTQTKSFCITPVDDFEAKFSEAYTEQQSMEGLFTISEIG